MLVAKGVSVRNGNLSALNFLFRLSIAKSNPHVRYRIHCFEGVTAVLFTVAISGYDACLVEDKDSVSFVAQKQSKIATLEILTVSLPWWCCHRIKCTKRWCCLTRYAIRNGSEGLRWSYFWTRLMCSRRKYWPLQYQSSFLTLQAMTRTWTQQNCTFAIALSD